MSEFIQGLQLSESFYQEAAKPVLETHFPHLQYSAALIGWSSEVLGYDDLTSTDHNWGPRFQIFLSKQDYVSCADLISEALSQQLPLEFCGCPTNFGISVQGDQRAMERIVTGPVAHKIDIDTIEDYFERYLGYTPYAEISAADWLSFSEHKLLAVTSGKVFHDGLGSLEQLRQQFSYYPQEVWLYVLAAQWAKISEEEAFVGRCGEVGDELGSMVIAVRQVRNLMRLCFILEKKYAPYSKWFGTAFSRLKCGRELGPILKEIVLSRTWRERERYLSQAYELVARMHNELGITKPLEEKVELHGRPYYVLRAERFAAETWRLIESEEIKKIKVSVGSLNQLVDSDQKVSDPALCKRLKELYK